MSPSNLTERVFQTDFDKALGVRFAPPDKRQGLLLLLAFDHELAKIRVQASEPLLRCIRTQFWREALADKEARGVDFAKQLIDCFSAHPATLLGLEDLIEAHEKYFDKPHSFELLWSEGIDRHGVLFKLAANFLEPDNASRQSCFFDNCGAAYGGVRQLCTGLIPAQGEDDKIEKYLEQTKASYANLAADLVALSPLVRPAILPVALVPPYLDLFQSSDRKVSKPIDLFALKKAWILWRTARNGF